MRFRLQAEFNTLVVDHKNNLKSILKLKEPFKLSASSFVMNFYRNWPLENYNLLQNKFLALDMFLFLKLRSRIKSENLSKINEPKELCMVLKTFKDRVSVTKVKALNLVIKLLQFVIFSKYSKIKLLTRFLNVYFGKFIGGYFRKMVREYERWRIIISIP